MSLRSERPFIKATLLPAGVIGQCPSCGVEHSGDLRDGDDGLFVVDDGERFIECACGELLDIGWTGFPWHEGGDAT